MAIYLLLIFDIAIYVFLSLSLEIYYKYISAQPWIHKDPITGLYHCQFCFRGFSSSKSKRQHINTFCKMSGKKSSPSAERSPSVLLKKLTQDYAAMKLEAFTADQIKNSIARSIDYTQVASVRSLIEREMAEDAEKIKSLNETVKRNLKEPWAFTERIIVNLAYEEAEITELRAIHNYERIQELLAKHRTACAALELNAIRFCPYTEHRQKVYEILSSMMPIELKNIAADL